MRRLCFDTESNAFIHSYGVQDIETNRIILEEQNETIGRRRRNKEQRGIRVHCAVVYDEQDDKYEEFTNDDLPALVAKLKTADVLITHNGPRWDLLVLEQVCGMEAIAALWSIEHKDLMELTTPCWQALDTLSRWYIPDRLQEMERVKKAREEEASRLYPERHFIAGKTAKCRYDVERTYAVFRVLEAQQAGLPRN
jgi:hypothetical protein